LTGKRFGPKITVFSPADGGLFRGVTKEHVVSGSPVTIVFGAYELIVGTRELWRNGRRVRLAPQAMRILIELVSAPGTVVGRDHLRSVLWPDGTHVDFELSLNTAVRKLRAALDDDADRPRYVQTVSGLGYRFIAPVRQVRACAAGDLTVGDATPDGLDALAVVLDDASAADRIAAARTWRESVPRRAALAAAAGVSVCAIAAIAAMLTLFQGRPGRLPLVVRAVQTDAGARGTDGDRALFDVTVASLQVLAGRLSPARLVVSGGSEVSRRGCHELTVSTHETGREHEARVTIRLLDTCRDEQMWAGTADVATGHQAATGVVRAAGRAVADQLLGGERSAREAAATTSDVALDAYRRGQAAAARGNRLEDLAAAVESFETAIRADPEFAPAWAALARTRATRAIRDGRAAHELQRADEEASRALAIDHRLADAYVATGQVRFVRDRDLAGADLWFQRARALGATAGQDALWHACVLNAQQRFGDALGIVDEAIAREPQMAALHAWRGLLLHSLHRYDEELQVLKRAAAIDPHSAEASFHLGMGYARRRQYDLALPALRQAVALSGGGGFYLSWFGRMAADAGDLGTAEIAIDQLEEIARTRGLAPALSRAVAHHIDARRHRSGDL
jgi:DNA-binding winged helix-turn-helix (wHTH) protein/tetratricopeptide (TPR) repeat protein